jgi:hypothetical protein
MQQLFEYNIAWTSQPQPIDTTCPVSVDVASSHGKLRGAMSHTGTAGLPGPRPYLPGPDEEGEGVVALGDAGRRI